MSDQKPAIGFIGVGHMGQGMAANLLKHGYKLTIKGNRNRQPVEALISKGAVEAHSPWAVADASDIVHLCLSNSRQVEAVMRAEDGLLQANKPGLIIIDTTTADPTSTRVLAEEAVAKGITFIDAPLGRTPKEAAEGILDAMVGADAETLRAVEPVIRCWAATLTHCGPVGAGHTMKLVMNFLSMSYGALYSEALTLAAKSGVPPQTVREVIAPSRMGCGFFETFMRAAVGGEKDAHKFTLANAAKDVGYVADLAGEAGVTNIIGASVRHYYTSALAADMGNDYVPALAEHVARLNGLDLDQALRDGEERT